MLFTVSIYSDSGQPYCRAIEQPMVGGQGSQEGEARMSDTPRTDAEVAGNYSGQHAATIMTNFARQLERELQAARKASDALLETVKRQGDAIVELNKELAALRGFKLNYNYLDD